MRLFSLEASDCIDEIHSDCIWCNTRKETSELQPIFITNQKAPGKGGHHLVLLGPSTHPKLGGYTSERISRRDPPHNNGGPLVKGVSSRAISVKQ